MENRRGNLEGVGGGVISRCGMLNVPQVYVGRVDVSCVNGRTWSPGQAAACILDGGRLRYHQSLNFPNLGERSWRALVWDGLLQRYDLC